MASFTSCACLMLLGAVLLLHQHPVLAVRQMVLGGRGGMGMGMARMGGQKLSRGRTVRYRVDGRRPEKYFADASVVRRGRPTQLPRSQRPFSSFLGPVGAPVMRATGGTGTVGATSTEPRTVRNFMNRFRSLLISPINRWTGLAL